MKKKDFVKHLRKNNCVLLSQGAKHEKYINLSNRKKTMLPRHNELKRFLCVAICKQLEIPIKDK